MLVVLMLLLGLNGGAFGTLSFHATPGLALTATAPATRTANDGMSGTPDFLVSTTTSAAIIPTAPPVGSAVHKGFVPTRNDGMSGTPDHPCQC